MWDLDRYYAAVAKLQSAIMNYTANKTEANRLLLDRVEAEYAETVTQVTRKE